MRASQSRQKSYHDKRKKNLKFQEGDHVFLRVTPTTGVGRALKMRKLTPRFIGPYQILKRVGNVAYQIVLPPSLSNLHSVFHVSQLRKYIFDPSHVIESDKVQIKENLTFETLPLRIEDQKSKELRGKTISLVKVVWGGATGESATWEVESQMRDSYPELFSSDVSQPKELERGVFVEDTEWVALTSDKEVNVKFFEKPTTNMVKHLNPLFIKATINSKILVMVPQEYEEGALEACNLTKKCFQLKVEVNPRPFDEVLND
ncbi:uncharacterized protein [Cicer arietinum]|uniref:uncharacterized protein n=1 Tax=Cicer arietinum TaxID=3827 RepID=UPI003CC57144